MTPKSIFAIIISIAIILAVGAIVMVSIGVDALGDLVRFVGVIGGIIVAALLSIAAIIRMSAAPIGTIMGSIIDGQAEANRHDEAMVKQGVLTNRVQRDYELLPAPPEQEYDVPITASGVLASDVDKFFNDAYELAALSTQWHRDNRVSKPTQLAPQRIAAKMNDYFRGSEGFTRWHNAMLYFTIKQMAIEDKQGGRSKGTYLTGATPEEVFKRMKSLPHPGAM